LKNKEQIIKELEEEITKLKEENKKLQHEKQRIENEFEEHKKQCSIFDNIKQIPSFVKLNVKHRNKTPGLKKGHKGYFRKVPERIDCIKRLILDICPECNNLNLSKVQEIRERVITDIPEPAILLIQNMKLKENIAQYAIKLLKQKFPLLCQMQDLA